MNELKWKKYPVLNDGFVCLVDVMGDDSSVVQAAKVSYGNDIRDGEIEGKEKTRNLIRYLMRHRHTTPFEMVEFKFLVRVPMDCWRQWIRHRTASVNEYSTRYTEAIDSQQKTSPDEWRLQATNNKQGSSGFLKQWPENYEVEIIKGENVEYTKLIETLSDGLKIVNYLDKDITPGEYLTQLEEGFHDHASSLYQKRLSLGIAKEQARKDLPLSTYTEAYWKIDLHNLLHFLGLRMDSHAQLEIRQYANVIAEIVKQIVPETWSAFEDYRLYSLQLTALDIRAMDIVRVELLPGQRTYSNFVEAVNPIWNKETKVRERDECWNKLLKLHIVDGDSV